MQSKGESQLKIVTVSTICKQNITTMYVKNYIDLLCCCWCFFEMWLEEFMNFEFSCILSWITFCCWYWIAPAYQHHFETFMGIFVIILIISKQIWTLFWMPMWTTQHYCAVDKHDNYSLYVLSGSHDYSLFLFVLLLPESFFLLLPAISESFLFVRVAECALDIENLILLETLMMFQFKIFKTCSSN